MNPIGKILNRIDVLSVRFAPDGSTQMSIFGYRIRDSVVELVDSTPIENIVATKERLKKRILILAVSGHGIITKPDSATQTMQQITDHIETFLLTNHDNGTFSIVRKEHLISILQDAEKNDIRFADIICVDESADIDNSIVRFALSDFTLKALLRISDSSSLILLHIIKKIRLPLLGIVLLMLIGNMLFLSSLRTRYNSLHSQWSVLDRQASSATDIDEQYKSVVAEFHRNTLSYSYALLADRIAANLPDKLILTQLSIAPVAKRIEELQPIVADTHKIVINGRASDTNDISEYTRTLLENEFTISLELSTVERERDAENLRFEIVIEL